MNLTGPVWTILGQDGAISHIVTGCTDRVTALSLIYYYFENDLLFLLSLYNGLWFNILGEIPRQY